MQARHRFQDGTKDRIFNWANYLLLTAVLLITLYPLWFVLIASISNPLDVIKGRVWFWPTGINVQGYRLVFSNNKIMAGYANSILYTVLGTFVNLVMTTLMAYPLSRKDFRPRSKIMILVVITMFFSGGMIPTFLLIHSLHMVNTIWALIIPGAIATTNMTILRTYMQTSIPWELQESASIDGCSNAGTLARIVLPLCMPVLAVLVIFYAVGHWNSYMPALLYLRDERRYPLQMVLRQILVLNDTTTLIESEMGAVNMAERIMLAETLKYAAMVVSSVPMLVIYPFVQKHFVQGVMIGAIKG